MPVLPNPRHEAFAQALALGQRTTQAYVHAGFNKSPPAASRLSKSVNISQRVKELQSKGEAIVLTATKEAAAVSIDATRTLLELARIGTFDPRKLFGKNGSIKPPHEWDDDTAAAIAGVEVIEVPTRGKRSARKIYKVTLVPKNAALSMIAKHLGMLVERVESKNANFNYDAMTEEELKYEATAILQEARKLGAKTQ